MCNFSFTVLQVALETAWGLRTCSLWNATTSLTPSTFCRCPVTSSMSSDIKKYQQKEAKIVSGNCSLFHDSNNNSQLPIYLRWINNPELISWPTSGWKRKLRFNPPEMCPVFLAARQRSSGRHMSGNTWIFYDSMQTLKGFVPEKYQVQHWFKLDKSSQGCPNEAYVFFFICLRSMVIVDIVLTLFLV